jgi:predicted amidohydrolase YtcJ
VNHSNRSLSRSIGLALAAAALAGCARGPTDQIDEQKPTVADLALRNGAIYTLDGARSWAETVAIEDGRIVYVGTDAGAKDYIGPNTKVVELEGRMVLPGIQDAHVHPVMSGVEVIGCDLAQRETAALGDDESPEHYAAIIKKCAEARPDDPWVTGTGWSMSAFGPGGVARKEFIDAVVPDRPVLMKSSDGHSIWVNSKALELAGITDETPDPKDGRIDRDPQTGEAIGSLQEGAARLVQKVVPKPTLEQNLEGLRYALELFNSFGITAVQDANANESRLQAYKAAEEAGGLSLHVVASIWWDREKGLEQIGEIRRLSETYTDGQVDARTVKIMQDGVIENFTAVVLEPYLIPGEEKRYGQPFVNPQLLKQAVTRLDADGFQVHFHAIGDGAVRQSLDAVEAARDANGDRGHRHHISHLQLIHPDDVPRFRELGVIANFQPLWAMSDEYIRELTLPFMTEQRANWLYPINSMYRSGAVVAFGSDWSVSTANPFEQIETAITHSPPLGEKTPPFQLEERIDLPEAIAAFTINAAYTNRNEDDTGSIETGKLADLIVLDRNLFEIPTTEISDTKVLVTLFEGKPVHGDLGAL